MCEAKLSAASKMTARVCWPFNSERCEAVAPGADGGDEGEADTVRTQKRTFVLFCRKTARSPSPFFLFSIEARQTCGKCTSTAGKH
jgi:hypothetical protein